MTKTTVYFENDSSSSFKGECQSALLPVKRKNSLIMSKFG